MLDVIGRGGKTRSVMIYDDIKAKIDAHHDDIAAAGTGFDPRVRESAFPLRHRFNRPGF